LSISSTLPSSPQFEGERNLWLVWGTGYPPANRRHCLINALSLTTPAVARVFSFAYHRVRAHFIVGARTASLPAGSVHLCHPNLPSLFPFINSVLPTNHLFDHDRP
jgi:hypothetical protein